MFKIIEKYGAIAFALVSAVLFLFANFAAMVLFYAINKAAVAGVFNDLLVMGFLVFLLPAFALIFCKIISES